MRHVHIPLSEIRSPAGYCNARRAAFDLGCSEAELPVAAANVRQREVAGELHFSMVDLELAASSQIKTMPPKPTIPSAARVKLDVLARKLGMLHDDLASALAGRVQLKAHGPDLSVAVADWDRVRPGLRAAGLLHPSAKVEAARIEGQNKGATRAGSKRMRLGRPRRWNARPWSAR
jgi:hypothetical protein